MGFTGYREVVITAGPGNMLFLGVVTVAGFKRLLRERDDDLMNDRHTDIRSDVCDKDCPTGK